MVRCKILIVEDEAIIALDLHRTLEALGHAVIGRASSGERALELAAEDPPDLVVMDVLLRGELDGVQTAELLDARGPVAVVFLSAQNHAERIRDAHLSQQPVSLFKPFGKGDLELAVASALGASAGPDERS